jgi:hypothetical protein
MIEKLSQSIVGYFLGLFPGYITPRILAVRDGWTLALFNVICPLMSAAVVDT